MPNCVSLNLCASRISLRDLNSTFYRKMKWYIAITLMVVVAVSCHEKYTTKYDDIDLEDILSNRPLLMNYVNCTLDMGRCTAEGKELKSHIRDALETGCEKCSDRQKSGAKQVLQHLRDKEPELFAKLKAKYDPDHKYEQVYEKFLSGNI